MNKQKDYQEYIKESEQRRLSMMIKKYVFGNPYETGATVLPVEPAGVRAAAGHTGKARGADR